MTLDEKIKTVWGQLVANHQGQILMHKVIAEMYEDFEKRIKELELKVSKIKHIQDTQRYAEEDDRDG